MLLNMLKGCCNDAVMNITPQNNYNLQGVSTLLLLALDREFNYFGISMQEGGNHELMPPKRGLFRSKMACYLLVVRMTCSYQPEA